MFERVKNSVRLNRTTTKYIKKTAYEAGQNDARLRKPKTPRTGIAYGPYCRGYRKMVRQMQREGWA